MPASDSTEEPKLIKATTKTAVFAAITLLCCLTLSINLQAQAGGDVVQKVTQLTQDTTNAQLKNDVSWMKEHLADGYVQGDSWGAWQTKAEILKDMQRMRLSGRAARSVMWT